MQELTSYISFSDAQKRYEIKQAALSYRIKSLGLQTKRKGRNTFLSLKHISLLDDLNKFLQENPTKTIDEFLSLQKVNLQSKPAELAISTIDELSANQHDIDASLMNHCITDESLISQDIPQIKAQITHILKAISLIEGTEDSTNQSLINLPAQEQIRAKDKEIAELKEEIDKLTEERKKANYLIKDLNKSVIKGIDVINFLTVELELKKQECGEWENIWIELIPSEPIHYLFSKIDGRVYLKTNQFDYDAAKRISWRVFSLFNR